MKTLFYFLGLLITFRAEGAYHASEGNISAIFGPYAHKTDYAGSQTGARAPVKGSFGLIVLGDINTKGSLEIAMLHMNKSFFRERLGQTIVEETQAMHISMGYRYWMSTYHSIGVGFYSAYSMDQPRVLHNDFPDEEFSTSARDVTEYGFDVSLQSELWGNDRFAVILDARYSTNLTSKESEKANHYGALLGLRYLIQDKVPAPAPRKK